MERILLAARNGAETTLSTLRQHLTNIISADGDCLGRLQGSCHHRHRLTKPRANNPRLCRRSNGSQCAGSGRFAEGARELDKDFPQHHIGSICPNAPRSIVSAAAAAARFSGRVGRSCSCPPRVGWPKSYSFAIILFLLQDDCDGARSSVSTLPFALVRKSRGSGCSKLP